MQVPQLLTERYRLAREAEILSHCTGKVEEELLLDPSRGANDFVEPVHLQMTPIARSGEALRPGSNEELQRQEGAQFQDDERMAENREQEQEQEHEREQQREQGLEQERIPAPRLEGSQDQNAAEERLLSFSLVESDV